jgi:predicted AlkP superfamily phosphohydrolase/phosphomutase
MSGNGEGGRKLLLVGLDAGDRDFIAAHADVLPTLSGLLRDGTVGLLTAEPMAGAVWPSFCTGTHPQDHGVFHHLQWDPRGMRVRRVSGDWTPYEPFWRAIAEAGTRVTVFDVPFVFPGETPALEVMNWGSHDLIGPFWCSDPALGRRFRRRFGLHPMGFEVPVDKTPGQLERAVGRIVRGAAGRAEAVRWLMAARPWDVFLVAFGEPHRAGHTIWPDPDDPDDPAPVDGLKRVYAAVDAAVAEVIAAAGPETDVVLFALHGMAPNCSQSHLTSVFMQRALARYRGAPAPEEKGDAPGMIRMLRKVVPAGLQYAVANAVPTFVRDQVIAREIAGGFDWPGTLGLCLHGDLAGYLRLNLQGRERDGAVPPEDLAALKAFLRDELMALTTTDGRRLVRAVSFPATEVRGARADLLPDLLVEWEPDIPPQPEVRSPSLGAIRVRHATGRGGNHRFQGFFVHRGPRQGHAPAPAHISQMRGLVEALLDPESASGRSGSRLARPTRSNSMI